MILISGEKLMVYLGVVLMLLGSYIIIADAVSLTPSVVAALGGFIFSIGLITSFVGNKGRDREEEISATMSGGLNSTHPLGYLGAASERAIQNQKKSSGNKALGFVLISVGVFIVAPMLALPLLFNCCYFIGINALFSFLSALILSPLFMFGIICLSFGIFFRRISYR